MPVGQFRPFVNLRILKIWEKIKPQKTFHLEMECFVVEIVEKF